MREVFWGRSASRDDVITLFVRESHLFVQLNPGGELTFTVLQAQLTAPPPGRSDGENQTRLRNVYGSSRAHFWAARSKQRRNRKHRLNSAAVFDPGGSARFDQSVSSPSSVRFTCCLPAGEARVLTSVTCPCCSVTGHGAGSVCL